MSKKCKAYSVSKLGLELTDNRKAFYAGWNAALAEQPAQQEPVAKDNSNYRLDPPGLDPLYTSPPAQRTWVGLTDEETHEVIGTAGVDLLELAKLWSDNKIHVYQFDNEARKIIKGVLQRAHGITGKQK